MRRVWQLTGQVVTGRVDYMMGAVPPEITFGNVIDYALIGNINRGAIFTIILVELSLCKNVLIHDPGTTASCKDRKTQTSLGLPVCVANIYLRNLDTNGEVSPRRMK